MAEQTFKSPGFFEREIDLAARKQAPTGTPAGIIGTAQYGPAFVPVIIGTFSDFESRFGTLDPTKFGPYAVREFLKNKDAVTYMRVLGAGANSTESHVTATKSYGVVHNAGFIVSGSDANKDSQKRFYGDVQFITAIHEIPAASDIGFPSFLADNDSFPGVRETGTSEADDKASLIRAMLMTTTGSKFYVLENTGIEGDTMPALAAHYADSTVVNTTNRDFKLLLYSVDGAKFDTTDGKAGYRIFTASLDPDSPKYISKILNTDPLQFQTHQHLLYADFPVDETVSPVLVGDGSTNVGYTVGLVSGSKNTGADSSFESAYNRYYQNLYGRLDVRYTTPKTTPFISQPFGAVEYNLFHFETLSDGEYANTQFKISIANLKASGDPKNKFGSFDVLVRRYVDTDFAPEILERYTECSLDPAHERFVGKVIGDYKAYFDHDTADEDERRLVISGRYPNQSLYVRIVINEAVYKEEIPNESLPFGFRGIPTLKTTTTITGSTSGSTGTGYDATALLNNQAQLETLGAGREGHTCMIQSIMPPLPYTFKQTRGSVNINPSFIGSPGPKERVDSRLHWGVKTTRVKSGSIYNANVSSERNKLVDNYTKYLGNPKLKHMWEGKSADDFNDHKFTLARVALLQGLSGGEIMSSGGEGLTGSAGMHMLDAAYIRNGTVDPKTYTVRDVVSSKDRLTLASLVNSSSLYFNRFTKFMKFTNIFYGGFDGLHILNRDISEMNDKATCTDDSVGGLAGDSITGGLGTWGTNNAGAFGGGIQNNVIASYRQAISIMTDGTSVNTNLLAIPGIREPFVTDHAADKNRDYQMSMYVMDIPSYDEDGNRLFIDSTAKPDTDKTAEELESRVFDNNYAAAYFPDVFITDPVNNKRVLVPSSIAAIGAIGYSDSVSYPWYAPAGFNRGGLTFVENVKVRLNAADRDSLYEKRINPIATFPNSGFVIFGQKTLQYAQSALDRVNVRRLLLEVKRQTIEVANLILFEQNTPQTRQRFVNLVAPRLALIQAQAGIESFTVVMDDSNNTEEDRENNRLNGKIVFVPTRAVEFISIDFIITNAGVAFE